MATLNQLILLSQIPSSVSACGQQFLSLRSPDLPLDVLDADFVGSLLIVVEPLAFSQVNPGESACGFQALGVPLSLHRNRVNESHCNEQRQYMMQTHISFELRELETPAVDSDDVLALRRAGLWIRLWRFENACCVFPLQES